MVFVNVGFKLLFLLSYSGSKPLSKVWYFIAFRHSWPMKKKLKVIASFATVSVVFVGFIVLFIRFMPATQEVTAFGERFASVQIGDTEAKVISLLGQPDAKEVEFRLGQKQGFENVYARAKASDSDFYLIWFKGIDVVFTIGINKNNGVRVRAYGGT